MPEGSKQIRSRIDVERVLLYHGSKSGLTSQIKPVSRRLCDFGQGGIFTVIGFFTR